jgi:predicted lipase
VPNFDPADAVRIGEFVNVAYDMYNNGIGGLTPDQLRLPGYTIHSYIIMNDFLPWKSMPEFYGYIAQKDGADESVVAIRGTVGATEWFDNVHPGIVPFEVAPGGIEAGFKQIFGTIKIVPKGWDPHAPAPQPHAGTFAEQVLSAVAANSEKPVAQVAQEHTITVGAHSLGSALATLYVMENVSKQLLKTPLVYLFASPRVGDPTFVKTYDAFPGLTCWRISNKNDLVPNVPPDVWGFGEVATLFQVDDTGKVKDNGGCHHAMTTYMHMLAPTLCAIGDPCKP